MSELLLFLLLLLLLGRYLECHFLEEERSIVARAYKSGG